MGYSSAFQNIDIFKISFNQGAYTFHTKSTSIRMNQIKITNQQMMEKIVQYSDFDDIDDPDEMILRMKHRNGR